MNKEWWMIVGPDNVGEVLSLKCIRRVLYAACMHLSHGLLPGHRHDLESANDIICWFMIRRVASSSGKPWCRPT